MLSTHNAIHELSPSDKVLFQSSLAFDLSVAQIWGALTAGATLLLAKKDVRKDPGSLASFIDSFLTTYSFVIIVNYDGIHNFGARST